MLDGDGWKYQFNVHNTRRRLPFSPSVFCVFVTLNCSSHLPTSSTGMSPCRCLIHAAVTIHSGILVRHVLFIDDTAVLSGMKDQHGRWVY